MPKKKTTQQKRGQKKVKAKRKAAKTARREDFSQAAARIVRQATERD
jgi:hypothetical protein